MPKRERRIEMRATPDEVDAITEAAERKGMPVARYSRECTLAVARGAVVPAAWLAEALEDIEGAQAKIKGVREYMPEGWSDEIEGMMDDIIHVGAAALDGEQP